MARRTVKTAGLLCVALVAGTIAAVRLTTFLNAGPEPRPRPSPQAAGGSGSFASAPPAPTAASPEAALDEVKRHLPAELRPMFRDPPPMPTIAIPALSDDNAAGGDVMPKQPLLVEAAQSGDPDTFHIRMTLRADVNATDHQGRTATSYAGQAALIHVGRQMIASLIHGGADVNHVDADGRTPLLHALASPWGPHPQLVAQLIEAGADPAAQSNSGETVRSLLERVSDGRLRELLQKAIDRPETFRPPVLSEQQLADLIEAHRLAPRLNDDPAAEASFTAIVQRLSPLSPEVIYSVNDEPRKWVGVELNRFRQGFDGFRIVPPPGRWDMRWQFIRRWGRSYGGWYIVPVRGTMQGFTDYSSVAPPREFFPAHEYPTVSQRLTGGQLVGGNEYVIWFHARDDQPSSLRLFIQLTPHTE